MSNLKTVLVLLNRLGLGDVLKQMLQENPGFQSAISKVVLVMPILQVLSVVSDGWVLRGSPIEIIQQNLPRLQEILEGDPANAERFVQALKKPPVNQEALFERFSLQGAARQRVQVLARDQLLLEPTLVDNPAELENRVSTQLAE